MAQWWQCGQDFHLVQVWTVVPLLLMPAIESCFSDAAVDADITPVMVAARVSLLLDVYTGETFTGK